MAHTDQNRIFQTIYTSVSAFDFAEHDLQDILTKAQVRNNALDITGILGHIPETGELIQLLEGREEDVRLIFESIRADPRHVAVTIQYADYSSERMFNRWRMCFDGAEAWNALNIYRIDPGDLSAISARHSKTPAMALLREHIGSFV